MGTDRYWDRDDAAALPSQLAAARAELAEAKRELAAYVTAQRRLEGEIAELRAPRGTGRSRDGGERVSAARPSDVTERYYVRRGHAIAMIMSSGVSVVSNALAGLQREDIPDAIAALQVLAETSGPHVDGCTVVPCRGECAFIRSEPRDRAEQQAASGAPKDERTVNIHSPPIGRVLRVSGNMLWLDRRHALQKGDVLVASPVSDGSTQRRSGQAVVAEVYRDGAIRCTEPLTCAIVALVACRSVGDWLYRAEYTPKVVP